MTEKEPEIKGVITDKQIKEETRIPTREAIILRLEALPGAIRNIEQDQIDLSDEINILEVKGKIIENEIIKDISTQINDENKPKYRNEMAREAAKDSELKQNNKYREMLEQINKKSKELKEQKIGYLYMDRRFKAAKIIASLLREPIGDIVREEDQK